MIIKQYFLALLISLAFVASLSGQHAQCGTVHDDAFMSAIEENKKHLEETWAKSRVEIFIPVTFHNLGTTSGEGFVDEELLYEALCLMNQRYDETELRFYLSRINYVSNSALNVNNFGTSSDMSGMRNLKDGDAMNIFLVSDIVDATGNPVGVAGYYSGGGNDLVVVAKNNLSDERYTLEHEVGHFLSLPHTHLGWDQTSANANERGGYDPQIHGDTVTITQVSSSQSGTVLVELVDGSNCTVAADRICDTPPDYGFGFSCGCCTMVWEVYDKNGDRIEPMMDNVMSYSENCSPYRFTEEQTMTMVTDYNSTRRSYLRGGNVNEYRPITEAANITAPGPTADIFNGVLLDWDDVTNADEYVVKIDDGNGARVFTVTESELYLQDLNADAFYLWSVLPRNPFGSVCTAMVETRTFFTGSSTTSTNEVSSIPMFNIAPNPASTDQSIRFSLHADKAMDAQLEMYTFEGKLIYNAPISIQSGYNVQTINPTFALESGLHIVHLKTAEGIITEKLIIK